MDYLSLEHITKKFATTVAVENFNLQVARGEFVSLLGPSGCGKTTTLRMIAGFESPTTGSIKLDGEDITCKLPNQRNVGMVFQSYALFPNLSIADNIGFGLKIRKYSADKIRQRTAEMLDLVLLGEHGAKYPYQLSGGQQQRIALARALAIEPRVLLLDEPLSALDAKIRAELRLEIRRIQQQTDITTLYITHDQEEALVMSDRVVVMSAGNIEQIGTPSEIYNYPANEFVARFIGQLNILPVTVVECDRHTCKLANQTIIFENVNNNCPNSNRIAIRPEEIQIGSQTSTNNLCGRVLSVQFLGAIVRLVVDIGGLSLTADLFNERSRLLPKVGEQVQVNFPVSACWLI